MPIAEGFRQQCSDYSLNQFVHAPTRGDSLLDLVLCDHNRCSCRVLPKISDHKIVFGTLPLEMPQSLNVTREVWDFKHARWMELRSVLESIEWRHYVFGPAE